MSEGPEIGNGYEQNGPEGDGDEAFPKPDDERTVEDPYDDEREHD